MGTNILGVIILKRFRYMALARIVHNPSGK